MIPGEKVSIEESKNMHTCDDDDDYDGESRVCVPQRNEFTIDEINKTSGIKCD